MTLRKAYLLFIFLASFSSFGQDVEEVARKAKEVVANLKDKPKETLKKGVKVSGGISSNSVYFDSKLVGYGRIPFESNLSGNVHFDFFGKVKMPFTFNLNTQSVRFSHPFDRQFRFRQPFQMMHIRPSYKGLTLILGSGAMNFSEYSLNGHRFSGVGLEYKAQNLPFYVSLMYGKLRKAVRPQYDSSAVQETLLNLPAFKRKGMGLQLGYKQNGKLLELILFRSEDQPNLLVPDLVTERILPEQNTILSLKTAGTFFQVLNLEAEWAISGLTKNLSAAIESPENSFFSRFGGLLETNYSTEYHQALKAGAKVQLGTAANVGLAYNRIEPGYSSHGAYFMLNDLENIALDMATQLLENKISLMASLGRQRNNLDNSQPQRFSQWVGSTALAYLPKENLSLSLNYSNFSSFTNFRTDLDYLTAVVPYDALDTLNYRQVNQNLMGNLLWDIASADTSIVNSMILDILYQQAQSVQFGQTDGSRIGTFNMAFNRTDKARKTVFNAALNLGRNDFLIAKDWLFGPGLGFNKQWDKVKLSANSSILMSWGRATNNSKIVNSRLGLDYEPIEGHSLNLSALFMNRDVAGSGGPGGDFWQYTLGLSYRHNF